MIYTALVVPYQTAFVDSTTEGWFYFELLIDGLFIFDLFVNFLSAREINDEEIDVKFYSIAINYMKGWFLLDSVACIPFNLIELLIPTGGGGYNKLLRLARLPRL